MDRRSRVYTACLGVAESPAPGAVVKSGPAKRLPRLFALEGLAPCLDDTVYVADGAFVIGDVRLGTRCSVWFGAVLRADNGSIHIGADSNVQDGAVIHCLPGERVDIGARVSIGHLACIHGASIGDRCLIGMQALVMDRAVIAADTLIAAGAVVPPDRSYGPGLLLRGRPARPVRRLAPNELDRIQANALEYVARAARFAHALRPL